MAITAALCTDAKQKFLDGTHDAADTYKIALYTSAAALDAATASYTTSGEVTGTGYTAGGQTLTARTSGTGSGQAWIDFDDVSWPASTFTARGALIYNSSKSNAAVAVFDFGADKSVSAGTFTLQMPVAAANTALIRIE